MNPTPNPLLEDTFLGSKYLNPDYLFNQGVEFFRGIGNWQTGPETLATFHAILFFLALFFLIIISYTSIRLFEIRAKERKHLRHEIAEYAKHQAERGKKEVVEKGRSKNPRWVKTLDYLFSEHKSDWKLAIVEADSMLEELMNQLGFRGENLGEKLRKATQETFHGLSAAWEAHTIRNRIAHEGAAFDLSEREAKMVIALYEQIFREYGFI